MKSLYLTMDFARKVLIIAILAFMTGAGAVQVFLRYTPGLVSFPWYNEIATHLFVWMVFLAASACVREKAHFNIDFFVLKLFNANQVTVIKTVTALVILLFLALIVYQGTLRTVYHLRVGTMLQNAPILRGWFYLAIPVGSLLMFFEYLILLMYKNHPFVADTATTTA